MTAIHHSAGWSDDSRNAVVGTTATSEDVDATISENVDSDTKVVVVIVLVEVVEGFSVAS